MRFVYTLNEMSIFKIFNFESAKVIQHTKIDSHNTNLFMLGFYRQNKMVPIRIYMNLTERNIFLL
jgi:hypothetical protein